jgi:hypothetical protein
VYTIDPNRQFMVMRFEWTYDDNKASEFQEAREIQQKDGVWVAMGSRYQSRQPGQKDYAQEVLSVVRSFHVGRLEDKEFDLPFPAGVETVDKVGHAAYRLRTDGSLEYLPLYKPEAGMITLSKPHLMQDWADVTGN